MADQGTFRPTAWGRAVVAVMMTLFALAATTGAAGASPAADRNGSPGFAAQASSLGLTSAQADGLQRTADGYLAKTDGTQVAINKIVTRAGGELLIPLPGEKYARDLADKNGARTAAMRHLPVHLRMRVRTPGLRGCPPELLRLQHAEQHSVERERVLEEQPGISPEGEVLRHQRQSRLDFARRIQPGQQRPLGLGLLPQPLLGPV